MRKFALILCMASLISVSACGPGDASAIASAGTAVANSPIGTIADAIPNPTPAPVTAVATVVMSKAVPVLLVAEKAYTVATEEAIAQVKKGKVSEARKAQINKINREALAVLKVSYIAVNAGDTALQVVQARSLLGMAQALLAAIT